MNVEISPLLTTLKSKKITFNVDFRTHKNRVLYIRSTLNVIVRVLYT